MSNMSIRNASRVIGMVLIAMGIGYLTGRISADIEGTIISNLERVAAECTPRWHDKLWEYVDAPVAYVKGWMR